MRFKTLKTVKFLEKVFKKKAGVKFITVMPRQGTHHNAWTRSRDPATEDPSVQGRPFHCVNPRRKTETNPVIGILKYKGGGHTIFTNPGEGDAGATYLFLPRTLASVKLASSEGGVKPWWEESWTEILTKNRKKWGQKKRCKI